MPVIGIAGVQVEVIGYFSHTESHQYFLTLNGDVITKTETIKAEIYTIDGEIPYIDEVCRYSSLPMEYITDETKNQLIKGKISCKIDEMTLYFDPNVKTFSEVLSSIPGYSVNIYTVDSSDNFIGYVSAITDYNESDVELRPTKRLIDENNKYVSADDLIVEGAQYRWIKEENEPSLGISVNVIFWDIDPYVAEDMLINE